MKKTLLLIFILLGGWFLQPSDKSVVTIGIVTDVQYCDCDVNGVRFYRNSIVKLDSCIKYFNSQKLDFVAHLGDVIDRDFKSFDTILPHFKKLKAPVYMVLGNHEFYVEEENKSKVISKLKLKSYYYSINKGNWQFIFLNGNDLSFRAPQDSIQKKERDTLYAKLLRTKKCNTGKANGGLSSKQFDWLKNLLEEASKKNKKVIVMCHFPIYPVACHSLFNDEELTEMLTKYKCVKAYFCGHNHAGGYAQKGGVHFINFMGMVDTETSPAFAKVTLTSDSIFVDGHGREPSRRLKTF
jgi:predicted phosphodiesterase